MDSLLPFLYGSCIPYKLPVYPGALRVARHPIGIIGFWANQVACRKFGLAEALNIAHYFHLVRLSGASSAATHVLGVIPRVCRKSSTKALGWR